MGNDFRKAFLNAGLVSEKEVKKLEKKLQKQEETKAGQNLGKLKGKSKGASLMNLAFAQTVADFKKIAKAVLLEESDPETVAEVVRLAHNLKDEDGGKKLVWLVLGLKDLLNRVNPEHKVKVINRALRNANPTIETDPLWFNK